MGEGSDRCPQCGGLVEVRTIGQDVRLECTACGALGIYLQSLSRLVDPSILKSLWRSARLEKRTLDVLCPQCGTRMVRASSIENVNPFGVCTSCQTFWFERNEVTFAIMDTEDPSLGPGQLQDPGEKVGETDTDLSPGRPVGAQVQGFLVGIRFLEALMGVIEDILIWFFGSTQWKQWDHVHWEQTALFRWKSKERGQDPPIHLHRRHRRRWFRRHDQDARDQDQ